MLFNKSSFISNESHYLDSILIRIVQCNQFSIWFQINQIFWLDGSWWCLFWIYVISTSARWPWLSHLRKLNENNKITITRLHLIGIDLHSFLQFRDSDIVRPQIAFPGSSRQAFHSTNQWLNRNKRKRKGVVPIN